MIPGQARIPGSTLVAVLVLGCRPSPGLLAGAPTPDSAGTGVEIRTDRPTYRPGDVIELSVTNHGAATVAFNPCTRALEREQGGGWEPVAEPDRMCTMEAWILGPGETRAGRTELPGDLSPGRYRVLLSFSTEGEPEPAARLEARSAPVSVHR